MTTDLPPAPTRATERLSEGAPALTLRGVRLVFAGPPEVTALHHVDLKIQKGEFVAVVGPSGAGKSSLLNVIGLLTRPTSGQVELGQVEAGSASDTELTQLRARSIGFVFQAFHLLDDRTALENVALPLRYQRVPAREAATRGLAALSEVGLANLAGSPARVFSGGERQRVAIARALVTAPDLLLCDEPTGNLDSHNSQRVMTLLGDLHRAGRTVVLITHDEAIASTAQRVVRIVDGTIVGDSGGQDRSSDERTHLDRPTPEPVRRGRRHRLRLPDLVDEALAALLDRKTRTLLTCLGTVLGVATLVSVLGLASTATNQISSRFDRLAATTVSAETGLAAALEPARLARASALNGVTGVALVWAVNEAEVGAAHGSSADALAASSLPVAALSSEAWSVVEPTMAAGEAFESSAGGERVAVVGAGAAFQLGITEWTTDTQVRIDRENYRVVGVLEDVNRRPDLLLSVIVPADTARSTWGAPPASADSEIIVETRPGAAVQVAGELPYALAPERPSSVIVTPPPDPRDLRSDVTVDLSGLFLVLAAVTVIVGMVGVANTSLVAVLERTREIGLRRAIGATRADISRQFLSEAALIGGMGGIVGTFIGLAVVVAVSIARDWTPVLSPVLLVVVPGAGLLSGVAAGLMPARRAARTDPIEALRR